MDSLLEEIERFLALTKMSETAFGINAVNDAKFVKNIRSGRRCWPETIAKVKSYMMTVATQGLSA